MVCKELGSSERVVQACHAAVESVIKWGWLAPFREWHSEHKTMVVYGLAGPEFDQLVEKVSKDSRFHVWREPDMANLPTAVAAFPMREEEFQRLMAGEGMDAGRMTLL